MGLGGCGYFVMGLEGWGVFTLAWVGVTVDLEGMV